MFSEFGWVADEVVAKDTADKGASPWKHRVITANGTVEVSPRGLAPRPKQMDEQRARVRYHSVGGDAHEFNLDHVAYRVGTSPVSNVFSTLSEQTLDMIVSAIDGHTNRVIPLRNYIVDGNEGKYQIRCVAATPSLALFTTVNKAVLSTRDRTIWMVKTPPPPGVERRIERREMSPQSQAVEDAVTALGVRHGADRGNVRRAYRAAAMRSHPDRNPDDQNAHQKMVELNEAYELLTDESARLAWETDEEVEVFYSNIERISFDAGDVVGTIVIETATLSSGEDWVYAAALSGVDEYVYLGCYSGRIIVVNLEGEAISVLNVGHPVRALTPLDNLLMIQTDTRVFGVRESDILFEIDTWEKGPLTYTPTGFMYETGNTLHVHGATGGLAGRIKVNEPIRGYWRRGSDLQIETNRSTSIVRGVFG